MRLLNRLLLLVSVGAFSVVLAGCYGTAAMYNNLRLTRPTTFDTDQPIEGVETAPANSQMHCDGNSCVLRQPGEQ